VWGLCYCDIFSFSICSLVSGLNFIGLSENSNEIVQKSSSETRSGCIS
jgi:hypothetical protein